MFSDSPIETSGFAVTPDILKSEDEASSQTAELSTNDQETQTAISRDSSIQTDILLGLKEPPPYDSQRLASFLNRIYSDLVNELDKNDFSHNAIKSDSSYEDHSVTILHSIEEDKCQGKSVSCVSWNSTGMSLAISYCEPYHESWCTHDGQICIYTTNVSDFTNLPPAYVLHTSSCPKFISFHQSEPSILVGGLLNGQTLVWDLKKEDDPLYSMKDALGENQIKHSDAITCITWLNDGQHFATSGKDGVIIIWKLNPYVKLMKAEECFFIPGKHCNPERSLMNDHSEILSVSFRHDMKKPEFVAAVGGGNVLHCSAQTGQALPFMPGFVDPVLMKYQPHSGIVTCISCWTNDLFATCGTDSEIHVYKMKEKCPLHVIHSDFPLLGIEWVDSLVSTIACWGSSPSLHFYKVNTRERLDSHSVNLNNPDSDITTAKLNKQRKGVIAVGTQNGDISVWFVSHLRG